MVDAFGSLPCLCAYGGCSCVCAVLAGLGSASCCRSCWHQKTRCTGWTRVMRSGAEQAHAQRSAHTVQHTQQQQSCVLPAQLIQSPCTLESNTWASSGCRYLPSATPERHPLLLVPLTTPRTLCHPCTMLPLHSQLRFKPAGSLKGVPQDLQLMIFLDSTKNAGVCLAPASQPATASSCVSVTACAKAVLSDNTYPCSTPAHQLWQALSVCFQPYVRHSRHALS